MNLQPQLVDKHKRKMTKLRVSLLDACNMSCSYCMPEGPSFIKQHELLTSDEIYSIVQQLVSLGINEVRLTGGEPTLRSDFIQIVHKLSSLNLKKLSFTTNATRLKPLLQPLQSSRVRAINISLDSLNPSRFSRMTKFSSLETVLENIFLAQELGFEVKINMVVMKDVNDIEIENFVEFANNHKLEVRFLELMKIGVMANDNHDKYFYPFELIKKRVERLTTLSRVTSDLDSTSMNYITDLGAKIGFIASETAAFCGNCSRLRLDSKGIIYPCLFVNKGINIRHLNQSEITHKLHELIEHKPIHRIHSVEWNMNAIGG